MAVNKKIMFAFGLIVIGSFLVGMLWPIMISNNSQPTPTPQSNTDYSGQAQTTTKIISLQNNYLIECNATNAKEIIEGVEGVTLSFSIAQNLYSVTGENTTTKALFISLIEHCTPGIYRAAKTEYDSSLTINENNTLPSYALNQLPAYVGGFHEEGDEIKVNVMIEVKNNQIISAQIFELPETMVLPDVNELFDLNQTNEFNETTFNNTNTTTSNESKEEGVNETKTKMNESEQDNE